MGISIDITVLHTNCAGSLMDGLPLFSLYNKVQKPVLWQSNKYSSTVRFFEYFLTTLNKTCKRAMAVHLEKRHYASTISE